jgi:hypothetical protein
MIIPIGIQCITKSHHFSGLVPEMEKMQMEMHIFD